MNTTIKALNSKLRISSDSIEEIVDILGYLIPKDSYELTATETIYGRKHTLTIGIACLASPYLVFIPNVRNTKAESAEAIQDTVCSWFLAWRNQIHHIPE